MRGNRRYVMSRGAQRRTVAAPDDESSIPSVDTEFLKKLIHSGDTDFIDDLVGRRPPPPLPSSSSKGQEGTKQSKSQRRWPYVLFGMSLMYFLLYLWERQKTVDIWSSYMNGLKSSQETAYDSAMSLRGSNIDIQQQAQASIPQGNLFKTQTWSQGGYPAQQAYSNIQQQQPQQFQQQQQRQGVNAMSAGFPQSYASNIGGTSQLRSSQLSSGSSQLSGGSSQLSGGSSQLSSGSNQLGVGSNQLGMGSNQLSGASNQMSGVSSYGGAAQQQYVSNVGNRPFT